MSNVPPPAPSPKPKVENETLDRDTPSGVFEIATKTAKNTKVQWVAIGALLIGIARFAEWTYNKVDVVNSAMAQAKTQGDANTEDLKLVKQRMETIDSGTRGDIQRLERKIDENNVAQEKKIGELTQAVKEVLKEVKKK